MTVTSIYCCFRNFIVLIFNNVFVRMKLFSFLVVLLHATASSTGNKEDAIASADENIFNISLLGLFSIYNRKDESCVKTEIFGHSVQKHALVKYAIDKVNNGPLLKGIKLHLIPQDDCLMDTRALNTTFARCCQTRSTSNHTKIWGLIGSDSSAVSVTIAKLLGLLRIPQISYAATSSELSDKARFPYFFRTLPSDNDKICAIIEILQAHNWTYVSFIHEVDTYGTNAFEAFMSFIQHRRLNICLATEVKVKRDSKQEDYADYVKQLKTEERARVVISFVKEFEFVNILKEAYNQNVGNRFQWIGSNGFTNLPSDFSIYFKNKEIAKGIPEILHGALSLTDYLPTTSLSENFEDYIRQQTIHDVRTDNPFFADYLTHLCSIENGVTKHICDGNFTLPKYVKLTSSVAYADAAVHAFAHAIRNAKDDLCNNLPVTECLKFTEMDGEIFKEYLKNVTYVEKLSNITLFNDNLDGQASYRIWKYNKTSKDHWELLGDMFRGSTGIVEGIDLSLNVTNVSSTCIDECNENQTKEIRKDKPCCWICEDCWYNAIIFRNGIVDKCIPCGALQYAAGNECKNVSISFLTFNRLLGYCVVTLSTLGILLTIFTALVYWHAWSTPVVRASGRELCVLILVGVLLINSTPFLFCSEPTQIVCILRRIFMGMSFALVYASVLVKTVRISLVFNTLGKNLVRNYQRLLEPMPQVVIALTLTLVQVFVVGIWFTAVRPKVIKKLDTKPPEQRSKSSTVFVNCEGLTSNNLLVGLSYPILLLMTCTVYAIKIRKVPVGFNEAKHIGFVVYTTIVIWLAQLAMYLALTEYNTVIRDAIYCFGLSLNGYIIIFCLFGPKLYIVICHPEQNNQSSVMKQPTTTLSSLAIQDAIVNLSNDVCIPSQGKRFKKLKAESTSSISVIKPSPNDNRKIILDSMQKKCLCCPNCVLNYKQAESGETRLIKRRKTLPIIR